MYYADALNLLEICVENDVLREKEGSIFVYRKEGTLDKEGWYLIPKDYLAKELKEDTDGQVALVQALEEKDIIFEKKYEKMFEKVNMVFG